MKITNVCNVLDMKAASQRQKNCIKLTLLPPVAKFCCDNHIQGENRGGHTVLMSNYVVHTYSKWHNLVFHNWISNQFSTYWLAKNWKLILLCDLPFLLWESKLITRHPFCFEVCNNIVPMGELWNKLFNWSWLNASLT